MKIMNINDYQEAALRASNKGRLTDKELLTSCVLGLSWKSEDCADIVKKHLFQGHELDTEKLANDLGDVAWYLAVTAKVIGLDLETVLQMNVDKLYKRYPDGFSAERSIHREEEQ